MIVYKKNNQLYAMKILKKQEKVNESKSGDNNSPQSKYKGDGKK